MRLDKLIAQMQIGTRSQVKEYIKNGNITVNGQIVKKPESKVNEQEDRICFMGRELCFQKFAYYMLNKPCGVVTATKDNRDRTVMDLMHDAVGKDLFPVGRLDKDTEGLLLITNDGALSHSLLSPKKHVEKTYYVECEGELTPESIAMLEQGVDIGDAKRTLPASVSNVKQLGNTYSLLLSITEGRFHQVKRMIHAVGGNVTYLKRVSFGGLLLDEKLAKGAWRALRQEEIAQLTGQKEAVMKRFQWVRDSIKIDFPVSKTMKNTMEEAEQFDLADNQAEYSAVADVLDLMGKEAFVNGLITKEQWDKICERYPYM